MPVLPLNFDTILGLGATKNRATCLQPFLRLRGRFATLTAVVTFSPFWAGKFHRRAKIRSPCVIVHNHYHGRLPDKTKQEHETEGCPIFFSKKQIWGSYAPSLVSAMNMPRSGHGSLSTY